MRPPNRKGSEEFFMDIQQIISQMTLEEKAALCQGRSSWFTRAVERLGVPEMMMSDGPHGLRKQDLEKENGGVNDAIKAVCYPTAVGTACSFDRALLEEMGSLLGQTCQAEKVGVILGPAANIKRTPLCGRNFEYFSEDPYLSGEIAAAHIRGVQSQGVGTSLKHFAANNQETRRMTVSANVDERTLREIYLASFEGAVKGGHPWTVMCAYNKLNGVYCSENPWLLTQVLRKEWGFDGLVMSDWGAVNDRVKGVPAGLELEMPESGPAHDRDLVAAVREGRLQESDLDTTCERLLTLVKKYLDNRREGEVFDRGMQHHQARKIAREAMVLLKNDGAVLPIRGNRKVAFIGRFAEKPRYQGGGSSHITVSEELSALEAVRSVCPVTYAPAFSLEEDVVDEALQAEAVEAAKAADVAVLFLGLPEFIESEGFDRKDMALPRCQLELVKRILQVQKNVAVVLHNGAPVELPFADDVPAILEAYLAGQAGGGAVVDLLFGAVSPCGKLAETFPLRLEDTPAYLNFPGDGDNVNYAEGIYVGYRYYDKRKLPVRFPFGHGLTYTTFRYDNLRLSGDVFRSEPLKVEVDVTNTGAVAAKEIVQFYVRPDHPGKDRPVRELKGFDKVFLQPGETATASCTLDARSFSYWEERIGDWYAEPGLYQVEAAASSRDIRLSAPVTVENKPLPVRVTLDTPLGDIWKIPGGKEVLGKLISGVNEASNDDNLGAASQAMMEAMLRDTPMHNLIGFSWDKLTLQQLKDTVRQLNQMQGLQDEE